MTGRAGRFWICGGAVAAVLCSTLAAGTATTAAAPGAAPPVAAAPAQPAQREVVTLITGDRVAVTRWADGRTGATLLPGSPSSGMRTRTYAVGAHRYVIPGTVGSEPALDPSLFDVGRIARLAARSADGSVPVEVTFRPGVRVAALPGLRLDVSGAGRTAAGTVVGRYLPAEVEGFLASDPFDVARRISLPGGDALEPRRQSRQAAAAGQDLRTLTVELVDGSGDPVPFGDAIVINVDDARLFGAFVFIQDGSVRMSVPTGTYAVIGSGFSFAIGHDPELEVADDRTVRLDLGDATARNDVDVAGTDRVDIGYSYRRDAAGPGGLQASFSGAPVRIEPAPQVDTGTLTSGVNATLAKRVQGPDTLLGTAEQEPGVPRDLSYRYQRDDFAAVRGSYASGDRERGAGTVTFPFVPGQSFGFQTIFPLPRPARRTELLLGNSEVTWTQEMFVFLEFQRGFRIGTVGGPPIQVRAGQQRHVDWLAGPVHPGPVVASPRRAASGPTCAGCREGDEMRFALAPWTDTEPAHAGSFFPAGGTGWVLQRGSRTIERDEGALVGRVEVPSERAAYRLRYVVAPPSDKWSHSTRTVTEWQFSSGRSGDDRALPLLLTDYRLPVDLRQRTDAGRFGFRLGVQHLRGSTDAPVTQVDARVRLGRVGPWVEGTARRVGPGAWRVTVPGLDPGGADDWATLEVTARDRAGNRVTETVTRAFHVIDDEPSTDPPGTAARTPADVAPDARRVCGRAGDRTVRCLALLAASGEQALDARAEPRGYGPQDLRDAYEIGAGEGAGETVAVVVAYDYPTAARDLNRYRAEFGLPACTVASGCFTKVNQRGEEGDYPRPERGWALEAALDLQMATAGCPGCDIVLVEANQASVGAIAKATETAATLAPVVSHSYGLDEYNGVLDLVDSYDEPGITNVASAGNSGYTLASFPASAPSVLSVGGTSLRRADTPRGWSERAWSSGSSGCSAYFAKPAHQPGTDCRNRTVADVSAVADPDTGVAVYDSFGFAGRKGWFVLGGTSTAAPVVAGMVAAAGVGPTYSAADSYAQPEAFTDVRRGRNGFCQGSEICTAGPGYDAPTGLGTPTGTGAFRPVP